MRIGMEELIQAGSVFLAILVVVALLVIPWILREATREKRQPDDGGG